MFQFSTTGALLLLLAFYGITFLLTLRIGKKEENVDGYMVSKWERNDSRSCSNV